MTNLTERTEWQALADHYEHIANKHMRDWFAEDSARSTQLCLNVQGIQLDYSRHRLDHQTLALLSELANAVHLREKIQALFAGELVNHTEKRAALHMALRNPDETPVFMQGMNIATLIQQTRQNLYQAVNRIHSGEWKGATGKRIKAVVNIGIGGSCLGPLMTTHALKDHAVSDLAFHFISSVDESHLLDVLKQIDPETTLFIISSKSFGTLETLTNAHTIMTWLTDNVSHEAVQQQFIAITSNTEKARALGISDEHIFPVWDWVGGRYSIWSAIGLPLMLQIGPQQFDAFLLGAHEMDRHFKEAEFCHNMPVLMALIGIWYLNFFQTSAHAICPYASRLHYLIPYLQQAEMESNGKQINSRGQRIERMTSPVIFGGEGCDGQHAYHQLLLQGGHLIPVDFILTSKLGAERPHRSHHQDILTASCFSQAQALMRGKTFEEAYEALLAKGHATEDARQLAWHQTIPGNTPSNILSLDQLTPKNLGALLALYEHKIFVQGVIWDINSFDQWGVELGKQLLPPILERIKTHGTT